MISRHAIRLDKSPRKSDKKVICASAISHLTRDTIPWSRSVWKVPLSYEHMKNGVFENFHYGKCFEKFRFRWPYSPDTCGCEGNPQRKICVFKRKRIRVDGVSKQRFIETFAWLKIFHFHTAVPMWRIENRDLKMYNVNFDDDVLKFRHLKKPLSFILAAFCTFPKTLRFY